MIKISNLSVSFGSNEVLKNINLEIHKGEFVTILGPNGSGKTTLLRSIANAVKSSGGSILIEGQDICLMKPKEKAQKLSVVPQNTDVAYEFTCYDVVMMGRYPHIARLKGESQKDIEVVEESMRLTNVSHLRDRLFTEISGGERQRVVLAQAITQEPKVILLDEPISNLDPQYQIEILDTIKSLSLEKNLTVVAVLHDLNMAAMYSDRIVLLDQGKVYKIGTVEQVLTKENITKVFDTPVYVSQSPVINKPHIYSKSKGFGTKTKEKIHIICGGGSGINIIHQLYHNGYILSICVLNQGDMDWKIAKEYKLNMVEEKPFVEIREQSYKKNLENILDSDHVIVCPAYFGHLNIKNLSILLEPTLENMPITFVNVEDYKQRDFVDGESIKIIEALLQRSNCERRDTDEQILFD